MLEQGIFMNEITQRLEFDSKKSFIKFINVNLKKYNGFYVYKCIINTKDGLYEIQQEITYDEFNILQGRICITDFTLEVLAYFGIYL